MTLPQKQETFSGQELSGHMADTINYLRSKRSQVDNSDLRSDSRRADALIDKLEGLLAVFDKNEKIIAELRG